MKLELLRLVGMTERVISKLICIGLRQLLFRLLQHHQATTKNQISASFISCWDPRNQNHHGLLLHYMFQSAASRKISLRHKKKAFIAILPRQYK